MSASGGIPCTSQTASLPLAEGVPNSLSNCDGSEPASQAPTVAQAEKVQSSLSAAAAARQRPAAAPAVGEHYSVGTLAVGVAALMLLWALGQRGLVVRSGHDAMWRTAAEHRTVLPADDTVRISLPVPVPVCYITLRFDPIFYSEQPSRPCQLHAMS